MTFIADHDSVAPDSFAAAERDPEQRSVADESGPATTLPERFFGDRPPPMPRTVGGVAPVDLFHMFGAAIAAVCMTLLLFGRLAPFDGKVGFVLVAFLTYLAIYALIVSLSESRVVVVDRVMSALMTGTALLAVTALASVVIFVFWEGREALLQLNQFTEDMRTTGPTDPVSVGGVRHAIVGTFVIMGISLVLVVPLAIAAAVYLNESDSWLAELVRAVVTAMTALPSIVAGLFIFIVWILTFGYDRSGFAGSLAISLMMLPIIVRSADVVLRLVPGSLREAAAALGAPQWRVVMLVVLPTARAGLATSVLLGIARGIGETAPVLLVSGFPQYTEYWPLNPMQSLPLYTFEATRSGQPELIQRGLAAAAILMIIVLVLFSLARVIGGRPAGQLSRRQQRRAGVRSQADLARIEAGLDDQTAIVSAAQAPAPMRYRVRRGRE